MKNSTVDVEVATSIFVHSTQLFNTMINYLGEIENNTG